MERGRGGGLEAWGRRALERRGRETLGSLEQRKRPTMREDRRPHRPEPGRLTCPNSGTPLKAKPGTVPPAQGVLTGEPTHLDDGGYTLRQQAERLPPGCPEGFSVLTQSTDRSVSEDRTEAAVLKGLEE